MKLLKTFVLVAAALATMLFYGCENVNEPYDISSTAQPPYVELQDTTSQVLEGDTLDVVFELPVAIGEDVDVTFSISGTAEYETDWKTDDDNVSPDGGTVTIEYVDSTTSNDEYALELIFPRDGEQDGEKNLTVTLESAVSESGEELMVGQGPIEKVQNISIQDFDEVIPVTTGTYDYEVTGDFATSGSGVEVIKLADPVVEDGTEYPYQVSNVGPGVFSGAVPHEFSVVGTGVVIAPSTYSDVVVEGGTYNTETGTLTINVNYGPGVYTWTVTLTPQ
ncbi:hypothetical protein ACG2F4_05310 [Halalkalibaculum sp. DA3122]|uniref:hypothetical protein n=1 Tax=Halalkalibaculum sp. DA3122 TaxID=3373607 RepID=UPI003754465A